MSTIPRKNVGKGTPTVWWDIVPNSDKCEIYAYMAGGGCTLPGKAMVLMPGAGYEGITDFRTGSDDKLRLKCVSSASCRRWSWNIHRNRSIKFKESADAPDRSHNENANAAKMERLLEDGINAIGLDRREWAENIPLWV